MRWSVFWLAIFLGAGACLASDPVVSNVRASQRGGGSRLVDIWYDAADSDGDRLTVSVTLDDNGAAVSVASVTGDVGANVRPGTGKRIVWDAGADWNGNLSENVQATVTADDGTTLSVMVRIPGGTNSGTNPLGDGESYDPDYYPQTYSLTVETFYMDATEVTKAQWDTVYAWAVANGYDFDNDLYGEGPHGQGKASNHPVQTVNWYDCAKWCNARSQKDGRTPCYTVDGSVYKTGSYGWDGSSAVACNFSANGYRLPTMTEWEYAARGGLSGRRFPWGDMIDHSRANYSGCWIDGAPYYSYNSGYEGYDTRYATGDYPYTSPVGSFAANGYGLYDMAGNVWEWCNDASGSGRCFRGGCWDDNADDARCGDRCWDYPGGADSFVGFRSVCR